MSDASNTIQQIADGKLPKLMSLIPKDQSPKLYVDLIKSQIMGVDSKGNSRSDEEMLLFMYVAKRTGLDPLTKQIYAIFRWDSRQGKEKMTIQASIDGMRLVAQRTKGYAGQDDVIYDDESKTYPGKATVTVYKLMGGQRVSFTASARWGEYCQKDSKGMPMVMWAKMPYLMLGKCAEALALRKAFPNELSGIYAPEEIAQESNIFGGLEAPSRFKKDIEVMSGAPADDSTKSELNIQVDDMPEPKTNGEAKMVLGTTEKPDFSAMRKALKPEVMEKAEKAPIKDDSVIIT